MKKSFEFYQDVKVKVWVRQRFAVEAESKEEAKEMVKRFRKEDIAASDQSHLVRDTEMLFDTWEFIEAEDDFGGPTVKLYDGETKEMLSDNFTLSALPPGADMDDYLYNRLIGMYRFVVVEENPSLTYEDRLWEAAHGLCMENIAKMESMYPELNDEDGYGECWYDSIREDVIQYYLSMIDGRGAKVKEVEVPYNDNRKVIGYQLYDKDANLPDGLFSFMVFRSEKDARDYMECEKLEGFSISKYYEGDVEDPTFIGLRILKKGERVFNDEPCEGDSDLRDWATVCEDTAVLYADQIVLLDMENGGENETDACSVYQIAEGKVCPICGGPLCIEHYSEVNYPYYCPECNENFYFIEVE